MKVILFVLLVIGVARALPLKTPSNIIQNLLTQQSFNTLFQQIQQMIDFFEVTVENEPLIDAFPTQYQLAEEWFASQDIDSIYQHLDQDMTQAFQQFLSQNNFYFLFNFATLHPAEAAIPNNFFQSLIENSSPVAPNTTPNLEYYFRLTNVAYQWMLKHSDDVQELFNFFYDYMSFDDFISRFIYTFVSNFATLIIIVLDSLNQKFVQEFSENFDLQDFQEFLTPDIVYEILIYCITNLDDAAVPISFLTSLGINCFQVLGQIFAGTFNPEQFLTPEIVAAAFNWTVAHPNDLPDLVSFFMDYLPLNQISRPLGNILLNNIPSVLTSLVPGFSPELLPIFG